MDQFQVLNAFLFVLDSLGLGGEGRFGLVEVRDDLRLVDSCILWGAIALPLERLRVLQAFLNVETTMTTFKVVARRIELLTQYHVKVKLFLFSELVFDGLDWLCPHLFEQLREDVTEPHHEVVHIEWLLLVVDDSTLKLVNEVECFNLDRIHELVVANLSHQSLCQVVFVLDAALDKLDELLYCLLVLSVDDKFPEVDLSM